MHLVRIAFAGALLFGVGCELPQEGDLSTDQRVDPTSADDAIFADEDLDVEELDYAIDDTMALSSDIWDEAMAENESTALLEDEAGVLGGGGGKKKWKCCYCEEDDNHKGGGGGDDCYCSKDKKKDKAKKKAKYKCEDEHDDCEYKYCKKDHDDD
jgi:hypothetical protein